MGGRGRRHRIRDTDIACAARDLGGQSVDLELARLMGEALAMAVLCVMVGSFVWLITEPRL